MHEVGDVDARGGAVGAVGGHALHPFRERALLASRREVLVHLHDALAGEAAGEVELERLPRLARVGVPVGIAGTVEREHADVVDADVVGVLVAALAGVGVADDHLRAFHAHDAHQPADGLVEVGVREVVGMGVVLGVGHAGVPVPEEVELVVPDDPDALLQLLEADGREIGPGLGAVGLLVEDVAGLAAGARDEHRVHPFGHVPGHGGGALRGFVVGVGVHRQHAKAGRFAVSHPVQRTCAPCRIGAA